MIRPHHQTPVANITNNTNITNNANNTNTNGKNKNKEEDPHKMKKRIAKFIRHEEKGLVTIQNYMLQKFSAHVPAFAHRSRRSKLETDAVRWWCSCALLLSRLKSLETEKETVFEVDRMMKPFPALASTPEFSVPSYAALWSKQKELAEQYHENKLHLILRLPDHALSSHPSYDPENPHEMDPTLFSSWTFHCISVCIPVCNIFSYFAILEFFLFINYKFINL